MTELTRGQLIRYERRKRYLTQGEAAARIGVNQQQVSLWERDMVDTIQEQNIERIAHVLGIDPVRLRTK